MCNHPPTCPGSGRHGARRSFVGTRDYATCRQNGPRSTYVRLRVHRLVRSNLLRNEFCRVKIARPQVNSVHLYLWAHMRHIPCVGRFLRLLRFITCLYNFHLMRIVHMQTGNVQGMQRRIRRTPATSTPIRTNVYEEVPPQRSSDSYR